MKNAEPISKNSNSISKHNELKQNGYSIHYFTSGDTTNELIVFLHPAFADHRCFYKQIEFFSNYYRVVTIDLLGHGLSSVVKAKDKLDSSAEHIDTIIKSEGYDKAHFIGVSMGSLIAQYYALNFPAKVLSMTILGGYDINAGNKEILKAQRSESVKWLFKAMFSMNSFRRYVATVSVSRQEEQDRFYEMALLFTRKSFMVMAGLGNVIKQRENITRNYPLLILCGDKDIELAQRMSKRWHDSDPQSEFQILTESGHCANMDNAKEFNKLVIDFIKQNKTK